MPPKTNAWTSSEEVKLRKIVTDLQQSDPHKYDHRIDKQCPFWDEVAKKMGNGRTAAACLGRWMTKVGGDITRGNWTETEDQSLLAMFKSKALNSWSKRAIELGKKFHGGKRRGGAEVCSRYMLLSKKKGKKAVDASSTSVVTVAKTTRKSAGRKSAGKKSAGKKSAGKK